MSQPRYDQDQRAVAKRDNLPLFALDIDDRHVIDAVTGKRKGSRHSVYGVLQPWHDPAIRNARLALNHEPQTDEEKAEVKGTPWYEMRSKYRMEKPDFTYSAEEDRVVKYLNKLADGGAGAGIDPIGFLIASHAALVEQIEELKTK